MKNFFEEFKKFISRGNVFDLAIAVVMGGAFSDNNATCRYISRTDIQQFIN